jgi:hypothetical protein
MNNTEGLLPGPLVDMTVEELDELCHQLRDIVENIEGLICPEWSSLLDTTNELHVLRDAVDERSLN